MFLGKHQSVGATGLAGGQSHDGMLARSGSRSATLWAQQQMGVGGAETSVHDTHESQMLQNICGWLAYMHWKEGGADTFTLAMSR